MPELTVENFQLILVFVVPGFVSLKVYDLMVPAEKRDFGGSLIEVIAYSMINFASMSWAVILLRQHQVAENYPILDQYGFYLADITSDLGNRILPVPLVKICARLDTTSHPVRLGLLLWTATSLLDSLPPQERQKAWGILRGKFILILVPPPSRSVC